MASNRGKNVEQSCERKICVDLIVMYQTSGASAGAKSCLICFTSGRSKALTCGQVPDSCSALNLNDCNNDTNA